MTRQGWMARVAWMRGVAMAAAFCTLPAAAMAQASPQRPGQPAAPQLAPAPQPDRTTAQYGEWALRCQMTGADGRTCDVSLTIIDQRAQPLVQVLMRRGANATGLGVSVQVGVSVTVAEPARLMIEDAAFATLPFQRCVPQGCFAEGQQDAGLISAAGRAETMRLEYRNADGAPVVFQMPTRGLAAALQALGAT